MAVGGRRGEERGMRESGQSTVPVRLAGWRARATWKAWESCLRRGHSVLRGGEPRGVSTQRRGQNSEPHGEPLHQQRALCPPQRRCSSLSAGLPLGLTLEKHGPNPSRQGHRGTAPSRGRACGWKEREPSLVGTGTWG